MSTYRTITVDRKELIAKLKEHRSVHVKVCEESREKYETELRQQILEMGEELLEIGSMDQEIDRGTLYDIYVRWPKILHAQPPDYRSLYDAVTGMLQSLDKVAIELPTKEFQMYMIDDWDWKPHWLGVHAQYSATARDLMRQYLGRDLRDG